MKINVGGQKGRSTQPKGWKMVDISGSADINIDISTETLPFDDNSIEAIYTSHTLEHILPDRVSFTFSELYRVLKKNSIIRIVVPDIDLALNAYHNKDYSYLRNSNAPTKLNCLPDFPIFYLSSWMFTYRNKHIKSKECKLDDFLGGHVMVYNAETMRYFLKESNFINIKEKKYNKCSDIFNGCDSKRYEKYSLYMEATK